MSSYEKDVSLGRGLVKMYVSRFDEDTNSIMHLPFLTRFLIKLVTNFNMFSLRLEYKAFGKVYGTCVVTFYQDNSNINIVITELLFHPNSLCSTTIRNNIFCLSSWYHFTCLFLYARRQASYQVSGMYHSYSSYPIFTKLK